MTKKQEDITIYGGGMSGLIAAIDLARHDYEVVVREREKAFGGDAAYNPSAHTTSIDVGRTSEYVGIDLAPVFHPLIACPWYLHETMYDAPLSHLDLHIVERGNRKGSLDALLYKEARKLGVRFKFESPLKKEDLPNLPENTIVACGLAPSVYEMLEIPYLRWYGWCSRGEIGFGNRSWIWVDEAISEYGYLSSCNNYYFDFLFSIRHVDRAALDKYREFIIRHEGVEHPDDWSYISGAVPLARVDNPRLFHEGLILCGTISGAMDPFFWFGILGALISGKIAAMAVYDRAHAIKEFERFNQRFSKAFWFKNNVWYKLLRPRVSLLEAAINTVGTKRLERIMDNILAAENLHYSIPGP
ncbi:MAG: hypothetical protein A2W01_09635, partial [Candidatus Solincola sediminis]